MKGVKKLLVIFLAINSSLFLFSRYVEAVTTTPAPATASGQQKVITPETIALVQSLGNRMANRMQAAIDRMKGLLARIESRVGKLKAQGVDVSKFTVWTTTINTNLGSAQTAVGKFRADLTGLSVAGDPKAAFQQLQLDDKLVKDALTASQTTMKQVVQSLLAE